MPYPKSKSKIEALIKETYKLEEEVGEKLLQIDKNKKMIQEYFDETQVKKMTLGQVSTTKLNLVCKLTERATIKYDVDKLKEKLDDEMFLEVTKRTYKIKDIDKMIALLRENGVSSKRFKELIDVEVLADSKEIKRLYEAGELTMKQLKDTYTATISKSIKIVEEAGGND